MSLLNDNDLVDDVQAMVVLITRLVAIGRIAGAAIRRIVSAYYNRAGLIKRSCYVDLKDRQGFMWFETVMG